MRTLGVTVTVAVGMVIALSSGAVTAQVARENNSFIVTLLGTGTPLPSIERFGPSILVQAGSQRLLFDVGRGATIRLNQLGIPLRDITAVFVTHLHSDHVNGLADLWLTGWLPPSWGGRTTAFRIFGPIGTREMMSFLEKAHQADIRIRTADEHLPASGIAIDATDVTEGVAYNQGGVRVLVFDVDHGDAIKPALGYRVEYNGQAVVLSGDTRFSTNLVKYAKGADVVVHEVMAATREALDRSEAVRRIMAHHTSPEEAGRVFAEAKPRLAVYSHIILNVDPTTPPPSIADLIRETRKTYAGALEVGTDLTAIDVTKARVMSRKATVK
jgi:ribonuclease Z